MVAIAFKVVLGVVAVYAAVLLAMFVFQRSFLYHPNRNHIDPASVPLPDVSELVLTAPDGERLIAWRVLPAPGQPTLLYFHGNAGHLAEREERIKALQKDGYGLLMLAYRGFSGSTGSPSEANNVADALMAYDWLRGQGVAADKIVLFGESLGTGVATQLALARPAAGLILDSPYTSMADAAQWHYPWLPAKWLLTDRYDIIGRIGQVHVPLLVLHSEADEVVPVAMGRAVFAAANQPKRMFTFPGARHIFHMSMGSFERVREFVEGLGR